MLVDKLTKEMRNLICELLDSKLVHTIRIPQHGEKFYEGVICTTEYTLNLEEIQQINDITKKYGFEIDYIAGTGDYDIQISISKIEKEEAKKEKKEEKEK